MVAPDLEGLGAVATAPHPYFGEASFARSLIAGVRAAREAEPTLSKRVAVVGHSEGGHGALSVEAHINEVPGQTLVGTVASARPRGLTLALMQGALATFSRCYLRLQKRT